MSPLSPPGDVQPLPDFGSADPAQAYWEAVFWIGCPLPHALSGHPKAATDLGAAHNLALSNDLPRHLLCQSALSFARRRTEYAAKLLTYVNRDDTCRATQCPDVCHPSGFPV